MKSKKKTSNQIQKDLLSIIIPAYNAEVTIEKCLNSVISQSYKNMEVIVVNDGSTDNTKSIVEKIAKKEKQIQLLNQNNQGTSAAKNSGLRQATGNLVMFLDSDDYLEENIIDKAVKEIGKKDLLIFGYQTVDNSSKEKAIITPFSLSKQCWEKSEIKDKVLEFLGFGVFIDVIWNKIYRKELIDKTIFNTDLVSGEDLSFNLKYFEKCNCIKIIDNIGYNYSIRVGGDTYKYRTSQIESHIFITHELLNFNDSKKKEISNYYYNSMFYDLLSLVSSKNLSFLDKIHKMKFIRKNIKQYDNFNFSQLSVKKKYIFKVLKFNSILTYLVIKAYFLI